MARELGVGGAGPERPVAPTGVACTACSPSFLQVSRSWSMPWQQYALTLEKLSMSQP